jgi:hypothetical protein
LSNGSEEVMHVTDVAEPAATEPGTADAAIVADVRDLMEMGLERRTAIGVAARDRSMTWEAVRALVDAATPVRPAMGR